MNSINDLLKIQSIDAVMANLVQGARREGVTDLAVINALAKAFDSTLGAAGEGKSLKECVENLKDCVFRNRLKEAVKEEESFDV